MQTEIAMLLFFTIQVVFNICIMQKTDRIEHNQFEQSKLIGQNAIDNSFLREKLLDMILDKEQ